MHGDIRELRDEEFDAVIVNPPYFTGNSQELRSEERRTARQDATLTDRDLRDAAVRLLREDGIFAICLPPLRAPSFLRAAGGVLAPAEEISLIPREGKEEYLRIITLRRTGSGATCARRTFTVRSADGSYSREYLEATDGIFLTREQKAALRRELGKG